MTARVGVMSDVGIKHHCPEFFPPDMVVQKAMHPVHLQTNIFKGIKPPLETKTYTDFARYPINDLANFATVAAPARQQEAIMDSVYNYRKRIGSTNVPRDPDEGYVVALKDTHVPFGMKRPEDDTTSIASSSMLSSAPTMYNSAELTLGKSTRREGMRQFDQEFQVAKSFMEPQSRAMIANLAQGENMENILKIVFPGGFGARGAMEGFQNHGEVLSKLNREYHGDRQSLAMIARADAAAKSQGVIPDQSNFLSSIMGFGGQARMEALEEAADDDE